MNKKANSLRRIGATKTAGRQERKTNRVKSSKEVTVIERDLFEIKCPICGEIVEWFDICERCGYQNSGPGEREDGPTGPQKMTLREARKLYEQGKSLNKHPNQNG